MDRKPTDEKTFCVQAAGGGQRKTIRCLACMAVLMVVFKRDQAAEKEEWASRMKETRHHHHLHCHCPIWTALCKCHIASCLRAQPWLSSGSGPFLVPQFFHLDRTGRNCCADMGMNPPSSISTWLIKMRRTWDYAKGKTGTKPHSWLCLRGRGEEDCLGSSIGVATCLPNCPIWWPLSTCGYFNLTAGNLIK